MQNTSAITYTVTQPSASKTVFRYSSSSADANGNGNQKIVYH